MNGVLTEVRVGYVRLNTLDVQFARQGAAPAILNHVAQLINRGRFANHAVVQPLTALFKSFAHYYGAIVGWTFFIAGN